MLKPPTRNCNCKFCWENDDSSFILAHHIFRKPTALAHMWKHDEACGGNVLFFRPNSLASWCIRLGLPNFGQKKYGPSAAMIMIFQQLNLNILYIFLIIFESFWPLSLGFLEPNFHIFPASCWNCAASDTRNFVPQGRCCETANSAVCGSGVSWVRVFFLVVCKNLAQNDDFSAGKNSGYWA